MNCDRRHITVAAILAVAALLASCSDGHDTASGSTPRTTTVPERGACSPARPAEPSDALLTFSYGGAERSYLLSLPGDYDGRTERPLLFSFHGFGGSKEGMEANTALGRLGAERDYVVVTPDALGTPMQWNMFGAPDQADDFAFIHALAADLGERFCIDEERIYAAGHSNGSAFAAFLVCREPALFAAVAMVSATTPSTCADGVTTSVVAVAGTADPQVPYAGGQVGGGPIPIPAAPETVAAYASRNGCDAQPIVDAPATGVERLTYRACTDAADVVFYTVDGGGHPWPADPPFVASEYILDFFDEHPA